MGIERKGESKSATKRGRGRGEIGDEVVGWWGGSQPGLPLGSDRPHRWSVRIGIVGPDRVVRTIEELVQGPHHPSKDDDVYIAHERISLREKEKRNRIERIKKQFSSTRTGRPGEEGGFYDSGS